MKTERMILCVVVISLVFVVNLTHAQVPVEKQSPTVGISISAKAARDAHWAQRYSAVRNLPNETYVVWQMSKGSVFSETVKKFSQPKGTDIIEVLVQFTNSGKVESKVEIKNLILEVDGKQYRYWELLPGEVYDDYEHMAQRLWLSQDKPKEENFVIIAFEGNLYCTLKPGEKAWLGLMFFVPSRTNKAKLIAETPEKRTIELRFK